MSDLSRPAEPQEMLVPIGEALPGMRIVGLLDGMSWVGALMFVKTRDTGGEVGTWSVRRTEGLSDEELLGMVTLYVETLRK
jgi:hypothetical protein